MRIRQLWSVNKKELEDIKLDAGYGEFIELCESDKNMFINHINHQIFLSQNKHVL